jgi:hypothetical protein
VAVEPEEPLPIGGAVFNPPPEELYELLLFDELEPSELRPALLPDESLRLDELAEDEVPECVFVFEGREIL